MRLDAVAEELIDGPNLATLSTLNPDGQPQVSVVWVARDGNSLVMSTIEGRAKHRNLVADPRATVVVLDSNDSLRYVELRGATTLTHEGGSELIDALSSKYTGADRWDGDDGTANVRVVIRLEPTRVRVYA